jgi:putative inorganic carbon (HCO3(-)) transporter
MTPVGLARAVVAAELPIILAIAPLLMFPSPRRLVVLLVLPVVWWCARLSTGRSVPNTPLNCSLWLLLIMVGVSVWATFDIRFSLGKVSSLALGVFLYWAIVRWITTPERLRLGMDVFILSGAAVAVLGLLGTQWQSGKFPVFAPLIAMLPKAIRGVPGATEGFNANGVAGCLVLFVPLQAAQVITGLRGGFSPVFQSGRARAAGVAIHGTLLLLTGGTVMILQSRSAWLGLLVAVLAFMLWHRWWTRCLGLAVVGTAVVTAIAIGPEPFSGFLSTGAGTGLDGIAGRLEIWSRALYGIRDFPFSGMGMNAFRKVMPVLYPAFSISPTVDVAHTHNQLLQTALDLGLPGLIAYTSIWLLAGSLLVVAYRRSSERTTSRTFVGGLGAGLLAHFVFGMTDAIPLGSRAGVLFWFAMALTVALHRHGVVRSSQV